MGFKYFKIGQHYYMAKELEFVHVLRGCCINNLSFGDFYNNPANQVPLTEITEDEFNSVAAETFNAIIP